MLYLFLFNLNHTLVNLILTVDNTLIYNLLTLLNYSNWNLLILFYFMLHGHTNKKIFIYFLILSIFLLTFNNIYINDLLAWPNTLNYGFNLIHPLLFYYILIATIIYTLCYKLKKFSYIKLYIYILSFSLILGMYWGGINEGWGFFWTNDNIELSLLTLLLILVFYLHNINFFKTKWIISMFILLLIFFILLLRYNIFFTVHSFFLLKKILNLSIYFTIYIISLNKISINIFINIIKFFFFFIARFEIYFFVKSYITIKFKNIYQLFYHYTILIIYCLIIFYFYFYTISILNNDYIYSNILIFTNSFKNYFFLVKNIKFSLLVTYFSLNYFTVDNFFLNINSNYTYIYYIGFFYSIYYLWLISFLKIYNR